MFRSLTLAMVVYAYGQPAFYDYRPSMVEKPVQGFYANVNSVARDGQRALQTLNDARTMQYLKDYLAAVGQQLNSAI